MQYKELEKLQSENYRDLINMILKQDGWKYINSGLYYISTETRSWDESRRYCQNKGLDLAIINSEEEQAFLIGVASAKKLDGVWIGLSPNTKEMSTWGKRGAQQGDCANLRVYESPAVKEVTGEQCRTQKYFICEKYLMLNKM
uniref:C-type lectin domain-containing protein n=1 Tax=Hucho hucho TaxID=62062 RepID=A0A4W5LZJ5_9TELE